MTSISVPRIDHDAVLDDLEQPYYKHRLAASVDPIPFDFASCVAEVH